MITSISTHVHLLQEQSHSHPIRKQRKKNANLKVNLDITLLCRMELTQSWPKIDILPVYYAPPCRWRLWWYFPIQVTIWTFMDGKNPIQSTVAMDSSRKNNTGKKLDVVILPLWCNPSVHEGTRQQLHSCGWECDAASTHLYVAIFQHFFMFGSLWNNFTQAALCLRLLWGSLYTWTSRSR